MHGHMRKESLARHQRQGTQPSGAERDQSQDEEDVMHQKHLSIKTATAAS
jgi:hypothetical protein